VAAASVTWFEIHVDGNFRGEEEDTLIFSQATLFTRPIVGVPEPGMSLSMVAALATLGVVRRWQRNGSEGSA
jgi:hypothetical protein